MRGLVAVALAATLAACTHPAPQSLPKPAPPPSTPATPIAPVLRARPADEPRDPVWLGVTFPPQSTRVREVLPDTPGERAGIQPGDLIVAVDGAPVVTGADVRDRIALHRAGDRAVITVHRGERTLALQATVAARPELGHLAREKLVGRPAPAFALPGVHGDTVRLADFAGHVVVVDFWATWCGPCELEIPELDRLQHEHPDVRVIGISDEDLPTIQAYLTRYQVEYTIAHDDQHISTDYLIAALPATFIIDKRGVIRSVAFGFGSYETLEPLVHALE